MSTFLLLKKPLFEARYSIEKKVIHILKQKIFFYKKKIQKKSKYFCFTPSFLVRTILKHFQPKTSKNIALSRH